MTEPYPRKEVGDAARRPPEPWQLGEIRDLIRELAPTREETAAYQKAGRPMPNRRSYTYPGQAGELFQLIIWSYEHIPLPAKPKALGFANVLQYDSEARNVLLSQRHFNLDSQGDPSDDDNLRLRCNETHTPFDEGGFMESNLEFFPLEWTTALGCAISKPLDR